MTSILNTHVNKSILFIVVGRLGKNLVISKVLPVISTGLFTKIYVFREETGIEISGVNYITLPFIIRSIRSNFIRGIFRAFYEPIQLILYALYFRPAIIHGYYTIPKGINSLIASKFSGSQNIISIIGGKEEIETAFFIKRYSKSFIIWFLKKADHITTKGIKDNRYLQNMGISCAKISIYNGAIDIQRFKYREEDKDIDLLFAGYFDEFKGPQRALEIIHLVSKQFSGVRSVFIGNGPMYKVVKKQSENYGLSSNVKFVGFVDDIENFYKRARILIFPSANEGLSTAMLEAMACRCVPITSDVGNQTEAAIHEYNALVVPNYEDIASFSKYALTLLKNPYLLSSLADNAVKTIQEKYSPISQGKACFKFYSSLI
jgi:glycosyltransferase involved in cell wall biosynthesis